MTVQDKIYNTVLAASEMYGLPTKTITGDSHQRDYTRVRHMVWKFLREEAQLKHIEISQYFGRHRTTIIQGINSLSETILSSRPLLYEYAEFKDLVYEKYPIEQVPTEPELPCKYYGGRKY